MKKKKINKGQKLWKKANKLILGGNSLLSKNPNVFLPPIAAASLSFIALVVHIFFLPSYYNALISGYFQISK